MTKYLIALAALLGACRLDPETKPECFVDDDCYGHYHCLAQVCVANQSPIARDDVFLVVGDPETVEGDVLANDADPDGDALTVTGVRSVGAIYTFDAHVTPAGTVAVEVPAELPVDELRYSASDGAGVAEAAIAVRRLDPTLRLDVAPDTAASLGALFTRDGLDLDAYALAAAPVHGALDGDAPDVTYTPASGFCGEDHAMYRVTAANGAFDVDVTLAVGHHVPASTVTVGFGVPRTVDVLANAGVAGLTITSVTSPIATITGGGTTLTIDAPPGATGTTEVAFTVADANGCVGWGALSVTTEYPTDVVVGAGLTGDAFDPVISGDGQTIAFTSVDPTLVANDTNGVADVFVRDLAGAQTTRVSTFANGTEATSPAQGRPRISVGGRYVALLSQAALDDDAPGSFLVDTVEHTVRRLGSATEWVDLDAAARFVAEVSGYVYLHDLLVGTSGSLQSGSSVALSSDGTRLAFATNTGVLVGPVGRPVAEYRAVSVDRAGQAVTASILRRPELSSDGRWVVFATRDWPGSLGRYVIVRAWAGAL